MNKIYKNVFTIILFSISLNFWSCNSTVEYTSAKMALQNERWDEAETYLLEALKVEPENAEVMVQIGYHVHARKQEWKEMNEMFNKAVSINPDGKALGRPVKEITQNYREMYWAENYNKAVRRFNNYKQKQDKSILENAIEIFNESILIDPAKSQTYSILATCYYELGDSEKAIKSGTKGYEMNSEDFQTNYTLGQIMALTGNKKDALFHVEKSVQLDPSNTEAIRQLATLYYDNGEKEKSVETFEEAIKQEDDKIIKANLYFNLGVLYMQLDQFEDAEDNFFSAYDLNPEDTEALSGIAQTFENAEKWRRASKFYRELIELEPENPDHYKGMARVLIKQGDMDGATKYFEKAKKLGG
ncbi:MAG: hypothetical protein CMF90_01820 [Candidatus Marinimicrobia bacterium]|nr:hypothetical protein [Candidatus Neomarinimicrobiota bacterium]